MHNTCFQEILGGREGGRERPRTVANEGMAVDAVDSLAGEKRRRGRRLGV